MPSRQFYGQDMDMGHGSTEGTMMTHCMLSTASFDAGAASRGFCRNDGELDHGDHPHSCL